jgi:hypothetical protein
MSISSVRWILSTGSSPWRSTFLSIGKTGQHALKPFLRLSSRDLWQLYMLGK